MRLSPAVTFLLLASLSVSFLAGSSAPTPLYGVYMAEWGLTPLMITVIFGIYALAVLLALLVAGRLSDHLGRKPVLLTATLAQALTMVLFVTATGVTGLLVARVLQGLTTGAAVGAIGAAMIDLNKTRGTVANAVAPPFGTATGAIVAGVLVQYLPFPTHLVYVVFGLVFAAQAIGLIFMTDPISPRGSVLASLKPQLRLPRATREPLLLAAPVLVAVWALAGFYGALSPMLVRGMLGVNTPLIGGLALFVLAACGGISVLISSTPRAEGPDDVRGAEPVCGCRHRSAVTTLQFRGRLFPGHRDRGCRIWSGFQGAVRTVVPFAAAHDAGRCVVDYFYHQLHLNGCTGGGRGLDDCAAGEHSGHGTDFRCGDHGVGLYRAARECVAVGHKTAAREGGLTAKIHRPTPGWELPPLGRIFTKS